MENKVKKNKKKEFSWEDKMEIELSPLKTIDNLSITFWGGW